MRRRLLVALFGCLGCLTSTISVVHAASTRAPAHEPIVTRVAPIAGLVRPADSALETILLALINRDRQAAGLAPLYSSKNIARVALDHSLDMATRDYVSHFTLTGVSPVARLEAAGIPFQEAGENLGMDSGYTDCKMLRRIDQAMLQSPEHRANLLRTSFGHVGIGIAVVGNRLFVTEDFVN